MSAHPSENPWPAQTPVSVHSTSRTKRRKIRDVASNAAGSSSSVSTREVTDWAQIQKAEHDCQLLSGNDVFSCFPTEDTVVPQHQWAAFVWNSRLPDFTQTNLVNIYLFHADSLEKVLEFRNHVNPTGTAGYVAAPVNDTWFGSRGSNWNGANISYPFYWIITRSDKELDGTASTQKVFQAVQTTYADSVVSSMASTSSAASVASASAASASRDATATPNSTTSSGQLQPSSSSSFPHWAIAVIVVLGFLAIATSCILAFFIVRRIRRRNEMDSNRNSVGSASPMMAHAGNSPGSPLLAAAAADRHSSIGHHPASVVSPDGASTISRVGSLGDSGPFSGADAAIMADAFRKALRKPDFAERPEEEGESPDNPPAPDMTEDMLLSQQLAEEGRDIRSVSSSRGVKVETLSDSGDTAQDHPH